MEIKNWLSLVVKVVKELKMQGELTPVGQDNLHAYLIGQGLSEPDDTDPRFASKNAAWNYLWDRMGDDISPLELATRETICKKRAVLISMHSAVDYSKVESEEGVRAFLVILGVNLKEQDDRYNTPIKAHLFLTKRRSLVYHYARYLVFRLRQKFGYVNNAI